MVFQWFNIRQVPREVLKTAASGLGFNTYLGTWQMLMHEKPCLIPILLLLFHTDLLHVRDIVAGLGVRLSCNQAVIGSYALAHSFVE